MGRSLISKIVLIVILISSLAPMLKSFAGSDPYFPYEQLHANDPLLGHVNKKNASGYSTTSGQKVEYRINPQGFRDTDFTTKNEQIKVLTVGSSWLYGLGIDRSARWTDILDKRYCNLSVFNLSVQGYLIDQVYLLLKKFLQKSGQQKNKFNHLVIQVPSYSKNRLHLSPIAWHPESRKPYFKEVDGDYVLIPASENLPKPLTYLNSDYRFMDYLIKGYKAFLREFIYFRKVESDSQKTAVFILQSIIDLAKESNLPLIFIHKESDFENIKEKLNGEFLTVNLRKILPKNHNVNKIIGHLNEQGNIAIANKVDEILGKRIKGLQPCVK